MRATILNVFLQGLLSFSLFLACAAHAQRSGELYTPEQLDQLLGPVALYPDPLLAIILPASTSPGDLALAADYLEGKGSATGVDAQPWDPSVKALAHYPEIVTWMNTNQSWTRALGAAFTQQPADVMKSVQQLRIQARAAGSLVDTPQQRIDIQDEDIRIVPASANVIYVPVYDPSIVYVRDDSYNGPFITFGVGCPVGLWLDYQMDWETRGIWLGPWRSGWAYNREWRHSDAGGRMNHPWRPDPRHARPLVREFYRPDAQLPRAGLPSTYHSPVRPRAEVPHTPPPALHSGPDYRGRGVDLPRPSGTAPKGPLFDGYNRGSETRDYSGKGQASRVTPVRGTPRTPKAVQPHTVPPPHAAAPEHKSAPAHAPESTHAPASNHPSPQESERKQDHP